MRIFSKIAQNPLFFSNPHPTADLRKKSALFLDRKDFSEPKNLENPCAEENCYENIISASKPFKNLLKLYEETVKNPQKFSRIFHVFCGFFREKNSRKNVWKTRF